VREISNGGVAFGEVIDKLVQFALNDADGSRSEADQAQAAGVDEIFVEFRVSDTEATLSLLRAKNLARH
jgi:hypothetical protein